MKTFTGIIEFADFATGSKSEAKRPYIVLDDGSKILVYKENDNPFENTGLTSFEGKSVTVQGEIKDETLRVHSIEEVAK